MRLEWRVAVAVGLALYACTTSACRRDDLARLCDVESSVHASAATDWPAVRQWIDEHLRGPRVQRLVLELEQLPPADRSRWLRDRAAADGLLECPLAEAWAPGPLADPYVRDVLDLCAMTPPLDPDVFARVDGGARVDLMRAWADAQARTPALLALVARLAASPPRDRGQLLQREVERLPAVESSRCALADALDRPGP